MFIPCHGLQVEQEYGKGDYSIYILQKMKHGSAVTK